MSPSVPHPTGTNTGREHVLYASESATRAVDLAIDVIRTCITQPRPALARWASSNLHVVEHLDERRAHQA